MEKTCPCCTNVELRKAIRRGVEIDYCPHCNGIWLDNGELNKIVAESIQASTDQETSITEAASVETSAEESRKSILKSFLNLMGTTKDDATDGFSDKPDDDFVSKPGT